MKLEDAPFQAMPLLAGLSEDRVACIAGWFQERTALPGAVLASEGASGYGFFVVLEGEAEVQVDGRRVGGLAPGDFFGEVAMLSHAGRRTATVVALTQMRLASMFGTEFRQLEASAPEVIERLRVAMNERLEIADLPPE